MRRQHVNGLGSNGPLYEDIHTLLEEVRVCREEVNRVHLNAKYLEEHIGHAVDALMRARLRDA